MCALIVSPVGRPVLSFGSKRRKEPQEAQKAQNPLCVLCFLWFRPHSLTADVNRFLIDEELQAGASVLRQTRAGLLDAAEGHGRLLVARVNVDMSEARFDAFDIFLGVAKVLREDS